MTEKATRITKETLIPISLFIVLAGSIFFLGGISSRVSASEDRIKTIEQKIDNLATKNDIEVIRQDLRDLGKAMR